MEIAVHDTFESDADLRTHNGWLQYLREIEVLWNMEGRKGYYYGVVRLPQGSRWGGYGYCDGRHVSVGATNASLYARERGHNMTLRHAPCGDAGAPGWPERTLMLWGSASRGNVPLARNRDFAMIARHTELEPASRAFSTRPRTRPGAPAKPSATATRPHS